MEPLDLTKQPPRATRATLLGAMFLPRTIDKLRAELPGGTMGPYMNHDRGFSAYVVRRLGLDMDELRAAVGDARDEDEVVAWLRERIDASSVEETNRKLESFTSERMTPDDRALLVEAPSRAARATRPDVDPRHPRRRRRARVPVRWNWWRIGDSNS